MLILILFTDQAQHENTEYICLKSQLVRMLINQLLRRWTGDEIWDICKYFYYYSLIVIPFYISFWGRTKIFDLKKCFHGMEVLIENVLDWINTQIDTVVLVWKGRTSKGIRKAKNFRKVSFELLWNILMLIFPEKQNLTTIDNAFKIKTNYSLLE